MGEFQHQTVQCLANQFRQNEVERIGGRAFACRVYKLEKFIDLLDEERARDLAFKMLGQAELRGYILTWFDGSGYGQYTYRQVVDNIGERCLENSLLEPAAIWD